MSSVGIQRTRALKRFRDKLGSPVRNLNTVIVGLTAVGNGSAEKPSDLAVSWNPKNRHQAEREARGFSIRSLMVLAYDALDHYLADLGTTPSPISDERLSTLLRRESQYSVAEQRATISAVTELQTNLSSNLQDPIKMRTHLREFSERYCGKSKKPSIRLRLQKIYEHSKNITNQRIGDAPRPSYYAGVELLLAWRNTLVHDAENQLGSDARSILEADKEYLKANHAGIDIERLIKAFNERREPTLKEISTLVSILFRFVTTVDSMLLKDSKSADFFRDTIRSELQEDKKLKTIKEWAGLPFSDRLRKTMGVASPHGFFLITEGNEDVPTTVRVHEEDLEFLKGRTAKDLAAALE